MAQPWENDPVVDSTQPQEGPKLKSSDKRMQKTIDDIEKGVPAPKVHWQGEKLSGYTAPAPLQKTSQKKPWESDPVAKATPQKPYDLTTLSGWKGAASEVIKTLDPVGQWEAMATTATGSTTGALAGLVGVGGAFIDKAKQGKLPTGSEVEEAFSKQADLATYSPRTEGGQEKASSIGEALSYYGPSLMAIGPEIGMIGESIKGAASRIPTRAVKSAQPTAHAELDAILGSTKETPKPSIKVPESSTTYGAQMDLFRETPEQIMARRREQAQGESWGIQRDAQGQQGDLFLGGGKQGEFTVPKDRTPNEVEAAWKQREEQQRREAAEDAEIFRQRNMPEDETYQPSQQGGAKAKPLGQSRFGKNQRGSINWFSGPSKQERPVFQEFDAKRAVDDALTIGKTKDEIVREVANKEGRQAALDVLNEFNLKTSTTAKSETSRINAIADKFQQVRGAHYSDVIKAQELHKKLSEEAKSESAYHAQPTESGGTISETVKQEHAGLDKELDAAYKEALELSGGKLPEELEHEYNPRSAKRDILSKLESFSSGVIGGGGFGRKPGQLRSRNMVAVEDASGNRQVVYREGNRLFSYENGKRSETPFFVAESDKDITTGKTLSNGSKVVEATTKEIEEQTPVRYSKDAAANKLNAILGLKQFTREVKLLKEILPDLKQRGMVLPKDNVSSPPKGYRSLKGNPYLEKYWIQDRYANLFEDNMLNGGPTSSIERGLEIANSAAIGTMFWNPQPHLFNALDHYVNSVGFDLANPLKWKSISKSMVESIKDVAQLTPEYHQYLKEGWGLQYGSTVARDGVLEAVQKIPAENLRDIAKTWGMKPAEFVGNLYEKSRRILWGGSDAMMIAARKHLASQQGVDIFNKALGNYIEAHNPNYRIPANIGYDSLMRIPGMSEAMAGAVSRVLSKAMQSRAFNTFGRYHYGQFKSLSSNIHDLVLQNEHSVQSRLHASKNLAFVAFNVGVVYPFVWDWLAKQMAQDPTAEQRRAGAATIPYTVWHMVLGDEKVNKLLAEAFTLPPTTKSIVEVASNRKLFSGQHIWEPEDTTAGATYDAVKYLAQATVSPLAQIDRALKDWKKELASQFGIKILSTKSEATKKMLLRRDLAAAKRRQKQRGF